MFRFLAFLFGKTYEPCKSCETLTLQLELVNAEKERLLDALLNIAKPEVVEQPAKVIEPIRGKAVPWHMRKTLLENEQRAAAKIFTSLKAENQVLGQSNTSIEELEAELGLNDASKIS